MFRGVLQQPQRALRSRLLVLNSLGGLSVDRANEDSRQKKKKEKKRNQAEGDRLLDDLWDIDENRLGVSTRPQDLQIAC
jgi:hypothetical protein